MRRAKTLPLAVAAVILAVLAGPALGQCPNGRCGVPAMPRPAYGCPNGRCGVPAPAVPYRAPAVTNRLRPVYVWTGHGWVLQYR